MTLEDILEEGTLYSFYGVDGNLFKLGSIVFEAIVNQDDGYRSYLDSIPMVKNIGIFSDKPIVNVYYRDNNYTEFVDGTGHTWLRIGTVTADSYYSCFIFEYNLRKDLKDFAEPIENLDPLDMHPEKLI